MMVRYGCLSNRKKDPLAFLLFGLQARLAEIGNRLLSSFLGAVASRRFLLPLMEPNTENTDLPTPKRKIRTLRPPAQEILTAIRDADLPRPGGGGLLECFVSETVSETRGRRPTTVPPRPVATSAWHVPD
jgi:hypothetical protein